MADFEPTAGSDVPAAPVPVSELEITPPAPPRRRKTLMSVAGFVALAALISGTAIAVTESAKPSVAAMLQAAPAKTRGAGTADMTSHLTATIDGQSQDILDVSGTADFRSGDSTMTMSGPAGDGEAIRLVNHVEYLSNPILQLPNGAHWVSLTKADLGLGSASTTGLGSTDPSSGLDFLSAKTGNPAVVGHPTIDGEKTTHYKLTFDLTTIFALVGKAESNSGLSQTAKGLEELKGLTDLKHVPGEVWLDSSNRVRRLDYVLAIHGNGTDLVEHEDSEFSNFGVAVHVSAPSSDDVVPFSQVPNLFQDLAGGAPSTPA